MGFFSVIVAHDKSFGFTRKKILQLKIFVFLLIKGKVNWHDISCLVPDFDG